MKRITIVLAAIAVLAFTAGAVSRRTGAQTRNSSSKIQFNESFVFPNECTNELMDVTDVTTVTCATCAPFTPPSARR